MASIKCCYTFTRHAQDDERLALEKAVRYYDSLLLALKYEMIICVCKIICIISS